MLFFYVTENKTIRWKPRADLPGAGVIASSNDPCVYVRTGGIYKVESMLTFKFTNKSYVYHAIVQYRNNQAGPFQMKNSFQGQSSSEGEIFLKPSYMSALVRLDINDKICIHPSNAEAVYISPIDNMLDVTLRFSI